MRRVLIPVVSVLVLLALVPATGTARSRDRSSPWDLEVDQQVVNDALARGAAKVGAPPADAARYFADRAFHWAHPQVDTVVHAQPDGNTFRATMVEIEQGGGQATTDGYLVARGDDGWWYYGLRQADGRVEPTEAVVGRDPAPAASDASKLPADFAQNLAVYQQYGEQLRRWVHARSTTMSREVKAAGEQQTFRIPALLFKVNNTDFQPESTPEKFESELSGIGTSPTGTVTEMYLEQSFGQMLIQIDVYGPYEQSISNNEANDCWYGTEGGPILGTELGLGGYGAKGMAAEVVPQADPEVDFAQYDQDGNGYVDFLMIIHSGPDAAATGNPCHVWSHYFDGLAPSLVEGAPSEPTPATSDGVAIGPVLTVPEIGLNIGVSAHEIMHALGEPDYYGTAGTSGTGDWDLGAGGSWLGIPAQTNPLHFNPVMKIDFGWVEPVVVTDTTRNVALRPRASFPDLVMVPTRVAAAGSDEAAYCDQAPVGIAHQNVNFQTEDGGCRVEGFLIENLNRASAFWSEEDCTFRPADFDRQAYGSGLAIWHWDFSSYQQLGNNDVLRPMLDLEEFDRRDAAQELEQNITRAQPLDLFWGDPVGISTATATPPGQAVDVAPPADSPYTVTAPAPATSEDTPAWTVPDVAPPGTTMTVTLSWTTQDADDWDLTVYQQVGDTWVEAGSDGAPPGSGAETVTLTVSPGATYKANGANFASVSSQAEVSITYDTEKGPHKFGPANTWNADQEPTNWQFTNIRPFDYRGLANAAEQPATPIVFDLVEHDDTTVDVSGDFLYLDGGPAPLVAGQQVALVTNVYNHGGKAVDGATFALYADDPATGAAPIATATRDLGPYARDQVHFTAQLPAGTSDWYVVASAPGDITPGNDVVRTELWASPYPDADVLVVDHDLGWTQEQAVIATLDSLRVPYHVIEGEPTLEQLGAYDAAIWLTTTVSGAEGVLSTRAIDALTAYLDDGGQVWMASNRVMGYLTTNNRTDVSGGYFGFVVDQNLLDSMGTASGEGDAIFGDGSYELGYVDGRPYLDYGRVPNADDIDANAGAEPKGTVTPLLAHDLRPDSSIATKVEGDGFRTVFTPALSTFTHAADRVATTEQVLDFFGVPTGTASSPVTTLATESFQHVQPGQPWTVIAGAVSPDGIDRVEVRYRHYGDTAWKTLELSQVANGLYEGDIPGSDIANNGLQYVVRATTGAGAVVESGGGERLPNVASAPYGDPAAFDFGACAAPTGADVGAGDLAGAPASDAPLPTTGGGAALLGLLALGGALGLRRRRG